MEYLTLYQSPFAKKRVGKNNDGGYVISMLPGEYDLLVSGGISDDISFEEMMLTIYPNMTCYAFDGTISAMPHTNNKNITFVKKNLGNKNDENMTDMQEYIKNSKDIFMKIDIEGHEFRVMPVIIENNMISKVKQLVIEIHSPGDIQLFPDYFKGLHDITNNDMFSLIHNLNKTHTLVHFHANNGCRMQTIDGINLPHVFELTFIRNDYISEKIKNTEPLPTSLDMPNISTLPDYQLSGFHYTI